MSQVAVYNETVALLKTYDKIKTVDAWRDQFSNWKKEDGFLMPAVFIRMESSNFRDIGGASGIQMYDLLVTLMIGFEHYKGTDYDKALALKQEVFKRYHRFEPKTVSTIGNFLRNGEELQDLEFNNVLIFGQSYLCQNCMDTDVYDPILKTIDIPITRTETTIVTEITN